MASAIACFLGALGGIMFPVAPFFILLLLFSLSLFLFCEFRSARTGAMPPWAMVFIGLLWSISHATFPSSDRALPGDTVFNACLVNIGDSGRKTFSGSFQATFPDGRSGIVLLKVPLVRLKILPSIGDCFSGDVLLSDQPDRWESSHMFLAFLERGHLQGTIGPWNVFALEPGTPIHRGRSLSDWSSSKISTLESRLEKSFSADVSGLMEAMVLSDTSHLSQQMTDLFLGSGVYHLLSVSGEHMGLLVAFLSGSLLLFYRSLPTSFLRVILVRFALPRIMAFLIIPVLFFYTAVIGMPLPAGRALLAACFLLLVRGWSSPVHREDLFGISVLFMLILKPDLPGSLSMDLSLMALLGVMASLSDGKIPRKNEEHGGIPLETLKTGLWVTLFTTPLLWGVFGVGDLVGILSNPLIVPLAGEVLLPAGFAYLGLVSFLGWSPEPLTLFLGVCSKAVIGLVTFFSGIRLGQISLPLVPPFFLLLANGWLVALFMRSRRSGEWLSEVGPVVLLMAPLLFLSAGKHLGGKAQSFGKGGMMDILPALTRQSGIQPVSPVSGSFQVSRWEWFPEREYQNVFRMIQVPEGDVPGGR